MNENLPTHQFNDEHEQNCVPASEHEMVKYLLGDLPPEREQQIEALYFADDRLFDRLQAVKETLIDDYLRGNLCDEDRTLFEQNFLASPAHRRQVEFARFLLNSISAPESDLG